MPPRPKKGISATSGPKISMRLEPELIERMQRVRVVVGIPLTEQVRKALEAWLPQHERKQK